MYHLENFLEYQTSDAGGTCSPPVMPTEVEKIFFFLRVWYQSQIFSANFSKFWQGFSLKDSINTIENGIFFNCLLEFSITLEFLLAKDLISWYFPKYFLSNLVFENIFCELNSRNLPLFPPLEVNPILKKWKEIIFDKSWRGRGSQIGVNRIRIIRPDLNI